MITKKELQFVLEKVKSFNLPTDEKNRLLKFFQVRGSNKTNKTMSYKNFTSLLEKKNGVITGFVIGPKWNRLVFVDINVEI